MFAYRKVIVLFLVLAATLAALSAASAHAADLVKVAIGQRGLWDSAIVELGRDKGVFAKHGVTTEIVYTAGGGETQQAVISGSVDIVDVLNSTLTGVASTVTCSEAFPTSIVALAVTSPPTSTRMFFCT